MAAIQLTQVYLATKLPPNSQEPLFIVQGSESFIAINPLMLSAVGPVYQQDGSLINVRQIYLTGSLLPIYVTETYAFVKAAIDAL